jgi:hypothetical protein
VDFGAIHFPPSILQIRGLICGTRDALEHSANQSVEPEKGERRIYMHAASVALQKSRDAMDFRNIGPASLAVAIDSQGMHGWNQF